MDSSLGAQILASLDRPGTIGMGYLGVALSSLIYGITCIQSFQYYRSTKAKTDPSYLRAFVSCLWILDTVHQALVIHSHYGYFVTNWGNPEALLYFTWSIPASVIINSCVFILIRCFFLLRIWRLGRSVPLTVFLGCLAIARFILSLFFCVKLLTTPNDFLVAAETRSKTLGIVALWLEVATTTLYASTLLNYLHKGRTGMHRSNDIVTKIMTVVISTSMLSVFIAIADLISYLVAPTKLYNMFCDFLLETVDANAVLTGLNSRQFLASTGAGRGASVANSIPLSPFQHASTDQSTIRNDDSIIDTSTSGIAVKIEETSYVV